ncbi:MAG: pyridoxal-phosphate dependent enzyme, partial [Actinobacteria bacterium]
MTSNATSIVCAGCGFVVAPAEPYPFRCPNAIPGDDVDHVLVRELDPAHVGFPQGDEANPYVRYRELFHAYHFGLGHGMTDGGFVDLVESLDKAVAAVDGRSFLSTPFLRSDELSERLRFSSEGGVWVKDETGNVAGSHKARHLMGVMLLLLVAEQAGLAPDGERPLAIASCGNAALAAAVVARAADRSLRVFVPTWADPDIRARLDALGADVVVCRRTEGASGDPPYLALRTALEEGAIPFTVQGPDNGMAIEGGETIGYEMVSELARTDVGLDRLVVQVGGGALASSCIRAFEDAALLEARVKLPRIHAVQTLGRRTDGRSHLPGRHRGGPDIRARPPLGVHVAVGGGAPQHRHRHHRRRDLRLGGGRGRDAGHRRIAGVGLGRDRRRGRGHGPRHLGDPGRSHGGGRDGRPPGAGAGGRGGTRRAGGGAVHREQAPERTRRNATVRSFLGRDILSLKDFEREEFFHVFEVADHLAPHARDRRNGDLLREKTLVTAFYQPSTRTRLATEGAMHRLGGHVCGFSDAKMTRAGDFYQESIKDTVHMLEFYGDIIAMRHFQQGAPAEAARWASVPVINCGDGWGEHPTQVLTDLYTIWHEKGTLDGLTVLCVGDMRMRTMHSILYAMSQFDMEALIVCPPEMSLLPEFKSELDGRSVSYREVESVDKCIAEADVIYMEPVVQADYTKGRDERGGEVATTPEAYRVTRQLLRDKAKSDSIVLHSLPRMDELPVDVDDTHHARYWIEAYNGVVMRMAL